jgi:hypothetical protein
MKVHYYNKELFIEPETGFEREVLSRYHNCKAFLKCGISLADVLGILIKQEKETEEKDHQGFIVDEPEVIV